MQPVAKRNHGDALAEAFGIMLPVCALWDAALMSDAQTRKLYSGFAISSVGPP